MSLFILVLRLFLGPIETVALGGEDQARFLPLSPTDAKISSLVWDNADDIEIQTQANGGGTYRYYAIIQGRYNRLGWNLLVGEQKLTLLQEGRFSLKIPLEDVETEVTVIAFSTDKLIEEEHRTVVFPEWAGLHQKQIDLKQRRLFFSSTAEITSLAYKQTAVSDLSEWAFRVQGSVFYRIIPNLLELSSSVFYTGLPLSSSLSDNNLKVLGFNLMGGYLVPLVHSPWHLNLMTGIYYTTTYDLTTTMGYTDINGPQVIAKLQYSFPEGQVASLSMKYASIMSGFQFLELTNGEFAVGTKYSFAPSPTSGSSFGLSFDVSLFNLGFQDGSIQSLSETFGFCYNF